MTRGAELETDYLVVGAGTAGMGFVDALIDETDADVIMLDRRPGPGGHWLECYPFVQLHQPSMNYGVGSSSLGHDRVESRGRDTGFYERAGGAEICGYYDELMRHRLLASGRVRFFPMCDYLGDRRFRSRLTGEVSEVTVRRRPVDATYTSSRVPASDPPSFEVADGVTCVPVGQLTQVEESPAGYVIIGAGKTAMDAACWLLDRGTPPEIITWIRPRDTWILNRAFFQPAVGVVRTFEGVVHHLEAVAECDSIDEVFRRLEQHEVMFRADPSVQPTMLKGATSSRGEVDQLRRIQNVVRLGHVNRIDLDEIALERGAVPTSRRHLHIHCASAGLRDSPPRPIFEEDAITLQAVTRFSASLSAGLAGFVEASGRSTAEKNRLCRPNPWPQTPFDWIRHLLIGTRNETEWSDAPDLLAWVEDTRLNLMRGLDQDPNKTAVVELQGRFVTALFPALTKLQELATSATPAERARMYEPAAGTPA
ncbi:MAG TPA: NAD(P)/FAD-dependent oxidoreductase [Acidimicrobiales bacterium]|nr:NAD(P)/FAD-dependent oxidoreductase [Acidimicrobiales bacterium]